MFFLLVELCYMLLISNSLCFWWGSMIEAIYGSSIIHLKEFKNMKFSLLIRTVWAVVGLELGSFLE